MSLLGTYVSSSELIILTAMSRKKDLSPFSFPPKACYICTGEIMDHVTKYVLGHLEVDVGVLLGVQEEVLVVGGLLIQLSTQRVALNVLLAKVLEAPEPVGQARGLAVLARPRDAVEEHGGRDEADEDVEGCLYIADSGQPSFTSSFLLSSTPLFSRNFISHSSSSLCSLLFPIGHSFQLPLSSLAVLGSSHRYPIHRRDKTYAELLFHLGSCVTMVGGVAADLASH